MARSLAAFSLSPLASSLSLRYLPPADPLSLPEYWRLSCVAPCHMLPGQVCPLYIQTVVADLSGWASTILGALCTWEVFTI